MNTDNKNNEGLASCENAIDNANTASVPAGEIVFEVSNDYRTSGNDSMPTYTAAFSVPQGGATAEASLTVDDWGTLQISGDGGSLLISLTSAEGNPGPLGGHSEWSGHKTAFLEEGDYTVTVTHQNITMSNPAANASVCSYSIRVVSQGYTEPQSSDTSHS